MRIIDSCSTVTIHPASLVFAQWANPAGWPLWDADVLEVSFEGPTQLGSSGRMRPANGPAVSFTVTAFEQDRVFTDTSSLPAAKLIFDHRVTPTAEGSEIEVTVGIDGPLASLWSRLLRKSMQNAAHTSVAGLAAFLDSNQREREEITRLP